MKKIYLILFLFGLSTLTFAQKHELSVKKAKTKMVVSETPKPKPVSNNIDKVDLWTSDFSNPADWVIGNNAIGNGAADNWVIGTTGPAGGFAIDPIASTTAANGFALFDSDLLCSGDQSAWIGNATPIDLSATPAVTLQFQSFYRKYTDQIFVQVSTDNSTWTDFPINASYTANDISPNPQTILLNITTAIASNPSTVYFRFLFLSDASNAGDGCDYAWMVDDVSIAEAANNDIVVGKAFTHDIVNAYDYSIMPSTQLVPMVVGLSIDNLGTNAAVQAPMTVVINDGTSDVYNQATNFDLAVGASDTLWVATGFTPVADKTYTITFTAPDDDVLTNNVSTPVSYQTTQNLYAQDFTTTGIYRFDRDDETSMGNIFEIVNPVSLTNASVKFETGTTAPYARIILSRFNPNDATFNGVQAMEIINEVQYNIPSTVIGNGQFTTIPFPTPIDLEAGWYYVLEVRKDVAADRIFIGGSAEGDDDFSTVCFGPFGAASAVNYFVGWGFAPAIRMDFSSTIPIITSSEPDLAACVGQSITLTSSYASGNQWYLNGNPISGQTNTTLTVSTAGTYSVVSGGLTSADAVVTFDNPILVLTSTNVSCNGACDGSASFVDLLNGSGNANFSWNHGPINLDLTDLCAGTYTMTAIDNITGCSTSQSVTITQPSAIIATTSSTNSTCGNAIGSATVVASGGTGGYSYSWSNGANGATASNLTSGSYTVTVTDNSGCSVNATASVSDAGAPTLTANATNVSCNGMMDGTVSSSATGGAGALTYTWSNGAGTQNQSGLGAGTYSVTVEDANGCVATQSVTITQPSAIIATTSSTNSSCGNATGSATVVASGGSGGYSYSWSNGANGATASNLIAGAYTVTVTDNSGCSVNATASVSAVGAPTLIANATNVSCNGMMDGTLSSIATGGTGALTYTWSNGVGTQNQSGLGAGTYSVTVEDANGCVATQSVTITQPSAIIATTSSTNSTCGNAIGSATVVASGGSGGYSYSWSNGANGATASNLTSGSYTVTVTDNSGCSVNATASVSDAGAPTLTANATNVSCNGMMDGSVSSNASGGAGALTYTWSNGAGTQNQIGLGAGTYSVTVEDANGCVATQSVTITQPSAIIANTSSTNSSCGNATGSATVVASGGTGGYSYSWSNGANGAIASNLTAGAYAVTVTDNSGCSVIATASVSDAGAPTLSANATNVSCNGMMDGTVSSSATGGAGALTYTWSNGAGTQNQSGLGAGTYSVIVEDANGCSVTQTVTITEPIAIIANTSSTNSTCGNSDGSGLVVAVGGTGGFSYSWSNGSIGSSVDNLAAGNYIVTISDNSGCSIEAIVSVIDNGAPSTPTISSNDPNNSICSGETITLTSSSSTMNVWSTGATSPTIDVTSSGTYTLKLVDGNGCQSAIVSVTIIVSQIPNVSAGSDLSICEGDAVTLSGTGAETYTWDNGVVNGQSFTPNIGGVYTVVGTDINGCENTDNLLITLNNCAGIEEAKTDIISVYPNPSTGILTISVTNFKELNTICVKDQIGRLVVNATKITSNVMTIDLTGLAVGSYFVELTGNGDSKTTKVQLVK